MKTKYDLISGLIILISFWSIIASAQSRLEQGIEIFENKNYYGAERFFNDFIQKNPDDAAGYYYLGRVLSAKGDHSDAARYFEKASALNPENSNYFTWIGINYVMILTNVDFMKQAYYAPKALNALEHAVKLEPANIEARIWLAGYYANAPAIGGGSREKAIDQLNAIQEINPDHIDGLFQRGIILSNFKDYEGSLKSFSRILDLKDDYYPAYYQIGNLSVESRQFLTEGELSLNKYIDLAPTDARDPKDHAWWLLGNIYELQERNKEAYDAYKKAVELNPDNADYQRSLKNIM